MALLGMSVKRRRKAEVTGFHAAYVDKKLKPKRSIGLFRALFSGVSLAFGAMMCYVALHYIPAFVQPQKVVAMSQMDTSASRLNGDRNPFVKVFGPYVDAFRVNRSYVRAGETIQAQFVLPKGATADLHIQQCRRLWVIEIFHCQTVSREHQRIAGREVGTEAFTFKETGFYYFHSEVNSPRQGKYRVVWSRK